MSTPSNIPSDPPVLAVDPADASGTPNPTTSNPPGNWHNGHYPPPGPHPFGAKGDWRPHLSHPHLHSHGPPIGLPVGFPGQYDFVTGSSSGPATEPFGPGTRPPHTFDPHLGLPNTVAQIQKPPLPKNAKPASKVAGVRRAKTSTATVSKGKGKEKATETGSKRKAAPADSDEEPDAKRKRGGRSLGVANYSEEDIEELLDLVEHYLPIGMGSWEKVAGEFNSWATSVSRPERTAKSLEAKFKQFVRMTKPTGDAECPPHIERAHLIDRMIDNKVETRVLNDSEHGDDAEVISLTSSSDEADEDNNEGDSDSSDNKDKPSGKVSRPTNINKHPATKSKASKAAPVKAKVKKEPEASGPVARRADQVTLPRTRNSKTQASQFIDNISSALDPRSQAARDEERANRSMNTLQFLTMSQRVQELQSSNESLRNQIQDLQHRLNEAHRRADRAEVESLLNARRQDDHAARARSSNQWDLSSPSSARRRRLHHQYSPYHSPTRYRPSNTWTPPHRRHYRDASPRAPTPDHSYFPSDDNREIIPPPSAQNIYTARIPSPARSDSDLPEYVHASSHGPRLH